MAKRVHGFTAAFFTDVQPFVKQYVPAEIEYVNIVQNDEYSLEEQETLYAANRETIIDKSIRMLIINFFLSYVARADYTKYNLQAYYVDIVNLILARSFPKHKDKECLKSILIQFFLEPLFQKYEQLDKDDTRNVIQYMHKDPPILTYGSVMFFDHYMYYYFPDASMTLLEALYLLKKGIPAKNVQSHFVPSADPSLQKYLQKEITRDAIFQLVVIYEQNRTFVEDNDKKLATIAQKIQNYTTMYEALFGELHESTYEAKYPLEPMTPERFPHTSAIVEQAKHALREFMTAETPKPFAKEKKGKRQERQEKKAKPSVKEESNHAEPVQPTIYPFSLSPPDSMWTCAVNTNVPSNERTSLVYTEAMLFFLESGKVGIQIPDPDSLPTLTDPANELPTKKAVYGISLVIALNEILYNDYYRGQISKLIPGNSRVLSKQELQAKVFRLSGIGSCFVNALARLYSNTEQTKSNDTDCVILINPDLDETTFQRVYNGIVSIVTSLVCPVCENPDTVDIRTVKTKLSYTTSPVNVSFFQNFGYFPKHRAERVHLDISLFKVHEYTLANTILDISIYLQKHKRLREVWTLFSIDAAEFHMTPFPNPVALLLELHTASKLDLRPEAEGGKGSSRTAKVAFLQRMIPKADVDKFLAKTSNPEMHAAIREIYSSIGGSRRIRSKDRSRM